MAKNKLNLKIPKIAKKTTITLKMCYSLDTTLAIKKNRCTKILDILVRYRITYVNAI